MAAVITISRVPLKNTSPMAAENRTDAAPIIAKQFRFSVTSVSQWFKIISLSLCLFVMTACAVVRAEPTVRIALLAPFEGRYREIGYNALYAARLALQDSASTTVELLPIDDGGAATSAADRARAFAGDPLVKMAVVLGYAATDANTQRAFGDIPVLIVEHWGAQPETKNIFMLSNCDLDEDLTAPPRIEVTDAAKLDAPIIGGEVFALEQFSELRASLDGVTILSSAALPDADFAERYRQSGQFAPQPGLLASLTYDAIDIAIQAAADVQKTRAEIQQILGDMSYSGLNGDIQFENGCWRNAPIFEYGYDAERQLVPINDIVK